MMIASTVQKVLRRPRRGEPERTSPRIIIRMEPSPSGNPKLQPTLYQPSYLPGRAPLVSR